MCLRSKGAEKWWYIIDSGCSRHMTNDKILFTKLEEECGEVSFGDNSKGKIVGKGIIKINPKIENMSLVKGLKFNLIGVSQLCNKRLDVNFRKREYNIMKDDKVVLKAKRVENVYIMETNKLSGASVVCLASIINESWLWHKRLGHASMSIVEKLIKRKLVNGLPEVKFERNRVV